MPADTPAIIPDFVVPADVEAYTKGALKATDPRVPVLIKGAVAGLRRYCGWHIAPSVEGVFILDGPGGALLMVPTLRLNDVVQLATADAPREWVDRDVVDDIGWSDKGMVEAYGFRFPDRFRSVKVHATHGYDTAEVSDLIQVVCQVVAHAASSPMGATREQAGQVSISWATTAPGVSGGMTFLDRDLAFINSYRLGA